jgi:hypothetical protein
MKPQGEIPNCRNPRTHTHTITTKGILRPYLLLVIEVVVLLVTVVVVVLLVAVVVVVLDVTVVVVDVGVVVDRVVELLVRHDPQKTWHLQCIMTECLVVTSERTPESEECYWITVC